MGLSLARSLVLLVYLIDTNKIDYFFHRAPPFGAAAGRRLSSSRNYIAADSYGYSSSSKGNGIIEPEESAASLIWRAPTEEPLSSHCSWLAA